jgi:DNA invertase Pin-like site-specific DNA recombinase
MLVDRATIREAEDTIASGDCDLVIAEDLSRIFRNPRHQYNFVQDAVDADTRVICIADNLDTADENWEIMLGVATLRHGMTVPDVRRRVRRTATHAFHRGGMVLKVKFGYRKLSKEEAATGQFGPQGLRIAKRPECTPVICEMRDRVLRGDHYEAIAEWLRDTGIEKPPYAQQWTFRLVKSLLCDPLLSGKRKFRKTIHRPIYRTGKHRRLPNPEPEEESYPELAHLSPVEHEVLLRKIKEREVKHRQKSGRNHRLNGQPRSRAIWPAQHARCAVCNGLMYQIGKSLKCQNALVKGRRRCWNRVQVRSNVARRKILGALLDNAERSVELRQTLVEAVYAEQARTETRNNQTTLTIEREIVEGQRQADNLTLAIAQGGRMGVLLERLSEVNDKLKALSTQRESNPQVGPVSEETLNATGTLDSLLFSMAETSYVFADFLRSIVSEFFVHPVQALDTFQVRPRATLTVRIRSNDPGEPDKDSQEWKLVVDLFDPPLHIRHLEACRTARQETPNASLKTIARRLKLNHMTVKRALDYGRRMQGYRISEPYRELSEKPGNASRWKTRRKPT